MTLTPTQLAEMREAAEAASSPTRAEEMFRDEILRELHLLRALEPWLGHQMSCSFLPGCNVKCDCGYAAARAALDAARRQTGEGK